MSTEKQKENSKKYYYKNREKVLKRQKEYRKNKYNNDSEYRKRQLKKSASVRRSKQFDKYVEILKKINRKNLKVKYICGIADFGNKFYFRVFGFDYSDDPDESKTIEMLVPVCNSKYDLEAELNERIGEMYESDNI